MPTTDVRVPTLGESVVDATVGTWLKQEGDTVAAGEPLVQLETDKVNVDVSAERTGVLQQIQKREGDTVAPGDTLATLGDAVGAPADAASTQPALPDEPAPSTPPASAAERPHASPVARRLAEEHGLDLAQVPGTGTSNRITREDVERFLASTRETDAATSPPASATAPLEAPVESAPPATSSAASSGRLEERIRLSRRRQTIAQRLLEAQRTAAILTTFNEVDMTAVMEIRKRRRDAFQKRYGVGLGYMSFFTRAVVSALKAFPELNAEIQGDEMVLKRYYDVGIAVGADEGLVVPVVRDAERKSFADLEHEIAALAERARTNTLTLEDLRGGTFTITNGGVYGSLMSTPILSPPQVGILGMHKIQERPVAHDGQIAIRPMMYIALSYDHRLVDGRTAVQFLVRLKDLLEDPTSLLLES